MRIAIVLMLLLGGFLTACNSQKTPAASTTATDAPAPVTKATETPAAPWQNIGVAEFKQKMQEDNVVLLDVRTPGETAQGKIQGAQEMDFYGADFRAGLEKLDKSKTYLVYCRSGNRSGQACQMMAQMGFSNLYNLDGGWLAWSQQ